MFNVFYKLSQAISRLSSYAAGAARLAADVCIFFIVLALSAAPCHAADLFVKLSGEKITLHADQVPLKTILSQLRNLGIAVSIAPHINPEITARFDEKNADRVMSSILRSYDYSLVWETPENQLEAELRLAEIQIFQKGNRNMIQPLEADNNLLVERGEDGRLYVKDSLLFSLNTAVSKERLEQIAGLVKARIRRLSPESGIVGLELPDTITPYQAAEILATVEEIAGAEPDYVYGLESNQKINSSPSSESSLPELLSAQLPLVAVLDSGLSQLYSASPFVSAYYDAFSGTQHAADVLGHGTQMSLIAAGMVAPRGTGDEKMAQNRVVAVRTIDDNGFTSTATLLKSIDYAIAADARVISMSWGTEESGRMLEKAVRYATDRGLVLVAAAGNSPTGIPVYPAAYENVIGVGALLPDGSVWEESNRGDFVSVYGFGVAEMPVGHNGSPGIYAGTSISTAYIANQVARILQDLPDSNVEEIIANLKGSVSSKRLK